MNQQIITIIVAVLVGVGILLVLLGTYMSYQEWKKEQFGKDTVGRPHSLGGIFSSLAKLLEVLRTYPTGQRMVVLGILLILTGGAFGGLQVL